jgi:hypothetical protein
MALNFRIFHHRNSDKLHLRLVGDFDGSSALELVNTLNGHHGKVKKIVIHTSRLSSIHPFGLSVFQKKCAINNLSNTVTFTGKYSRQMAFEESHVF